MDSIVFDKVKIKNFLSIGDAEVDLSEQGFTLVKGINKETSTTQSNGSGKSSIFDSIFWTLTGETIRGASDVINEHRTSEGCTCELEFHNNDQSYLIVRTRGDKQKGNSCSVYIDGVLVSDQLKKSQEVIEKAIPSVSSPEILGSIILLGQGLPYKFSSFSPSKRKDMLELMSGSQTEIDGVLLKLTTQEATHTSTQSNAQSEIIKNQGISAGLTSTIATMEQLRDSRSEEDLLEAITSADAEIEKCNQSIQDDQQEIATIQSQYDQVAAQYSATSQDYQKYLSSVSMIKGQLLTMKEGNCPTCGKPYDVTEESCRTKKVLEEKVAAFNSMIAIHNSTMLEQKAIMDTYSNQIASLNSSILNARSKIRDLQLKNDKLREDIQSLKNISDRIDEINRELSELLVKNNELSKVIDTEQEYLDCIKYLKRLVSRDFKGYMLQEVISFMSSRSEYYSDYLFSNGHKIEVTLSGNKILITVGGRLYENLSGGERQRADLAVQFALRDMLVMTSGFSCNLLVLDEAFDNLDAQGSEALISLIVSEFSDIDSVFVVTHHSDISIPYDSEVTVTKESDGISYVR